MNYLQTTKSPGSWKSTTTLSQAKELIDFGSPLNQHEAKRLAKLFSTADGEAFVRHLAIKSCEKTESRVGESVIAESLLHWLTQGHEADYVSIFLNEFLSQSNANEAVVKFVDTVLNSELIDVDSTSEIFACAVSLVCELGLAIKFRSHHAPQLARTPELLDHIATFLLSVSNSGSARSRLALLHYFGKMEFHDEQRPRLNKIISRFGHTLLDQLFTLLFQKKTEAVALQYLLENQTYILAADRHAQTILHETWKFYMLKQPERFGMFLRAYTEHFKALPYQSTLSARKPLFQHLGALLRVASEVNHKELIQVLISCFAMFQSSRERNDVLNALLEIEDLRPQIKTWIKDLRDAVDASKIIDSASRFVEGKRGRKPTFARVEGWAPFNQINFLGKESEILKAS